MGSDPSQPSLQVLTDAHGEILATLYMPSSATSDGGPTDVQFLPLEGQQSHRVEGAARINSVKPGSEQQVQYQYDLHDRQQVKVVDAVPQLVERLDSPGGDV